MKFYEYLTEFSKEKYGAGITFIDIDETLFHTFAMIKVVDKETGKLVTSLTNQEFNEYKLSQDHKYDFGEFKDAEMFQRTSTPIQPTVDRVNKMLAQIKKQDKNSMIVFLTARQDFDNKEQFLDTFRSYGIDVDDKRVYIERTGNMASGTVAERKRVTILKYLKRGIYRRVRMIDDDNANLKKFLEIEKDFPQDILDKITKTYNIDKSEEKYGTLQFYALKVLPDGKLVEYK